METTRVISIFYQPENVNDELKWQGTPLMKYNINRYFQDYLGLLCPKKKIDKSKQILHLEIEIKNNEFSILIISSHSKNYSYKIVVFHRILRIRIILRIRTLVISECGSRGQFHEASLR